MSTQNNSQQQDPNRLRLGGAWNRKGGSETFISVSLSKVELDKLPVDSRGNVSFQLFATKEKNSDKSPDFNVIGSKVLWNGGTNTAKPAASGPKQTAKPTARGTGTIKQPVVSAPEPEEEENIL
ncbi:MAG: hypothetical protein EKK57_05855 [Proteobacteria bacterium]|nr:MAG: hypothetical protein EKK57_05855 [Pseudomonadota bacterium]